MIGLRETKRCEGKRRNRNAEVEIEAQRDEAQFNLDARAPNGTKGSARA